MNANQIAERTKQFEEGISSFLKHKDKLPSKTDVYLIDNTIKSEKDVPSTIARMLKEHSVRIVVFPDNTLGSKNKGAGEVGGLLFMRSEISKCDWFIHFEPRQVLKSFYFLESFLQDPRTLFTINVANPIPPHFNTGLYAASSPDMLKFLDCFTPERLVEMVNMKQNLENIMYSFFMKNTYCHLLDKMDLIWLSPEGNQYHW